RRRVRHRDRDPHRGDARRHGLRPGRRRGGRRIRSGHRGGRDPQQGLGGAARHRGRRDAAPGGPRGRGAAVSAPSPAGSRRATMIAAVAAAIGAIAVWSSTRLTWVSYTEDDGLTRATEGTMDGAQWHAALAPLALVMIAGMA